MSGKIEGAEQPVVAQPVRPDDRGQPALADAPGDVHLEHAVLGVQIAEHAHGVLHRRREDVRHTIGVADDAGLAFNPRQGDAAARLRQAAHP